MVSPFRTLIGPASRRIMLAGSDDRLNPVSLLQFVVANANVAGWQSGSACPLESMAYTSPHSSSLR